MIVLHGFPEFWYGRRHQIPPLAAAGFHVIAPDLRGYNLSHKPPRIEDYCIDLLIADLTGLIDHLGGYASVVGHDWDGIVAWYASMHAPQQIQRLAILDAAHPAVYLRELRRQPRQLLKSWYVFAFQLPWLPEASLRARTFRAVRKLFRHEPARRDAFSEFHIEQYVEAFRQKGALTGALNYYCAGVRVDAKWLPSQVVR